MRQDSSDPTGVVADTPGSEPARARDRKANAALQMKLAGATWEEIAEAIGYPTGRQALIATERALEKELHTEKSQSHMRGLAGKRLERLLRSVWAKAINPDHPEHLQAIARAREVIDRHAKLYGLDAPTEFVVSSPTASQLEAWVAQVVETKSPRLEEGDIFDAEVVEDESEDARALPS